MPLCDARVPLPLDVAFPLQPDGGWERVRAAYPWAFAAPHAWDLHVHVFAVRISGSLVLVDTGVGVGTPDARGSVKGELVSELALANISPGEVDHVILTHLHTDHVGGMTGPDGEPRFPYATYHAHPADWAALVEAEAPDDRAAFERSIRPVADRDRLAVIADDHEVVAGVRVVHAPGHTPGHRMVRISSEGEELLIVGDALHHPYQLEHPGRPSPADADPSLGTETRRGLLASARETGATLGVSHFAEPFGRIAGDDAPRWVVSR